MAEKIQELRAEFTADLMRLNQGISKGSRMMGQLGQRVQRIGQSFTTMGRRATIAGGILTTALALVTKSLIATSSEAEETQAKFEAVMGELTKEASEWAENFAEKFGRARIDVKAWMASVIDTLVPLGIAKDKAFGLTKEIVQLSADIASFHNAAGGAAEVMGLLISAMVGNHEAVRRYGIIITETMLKQEAINSGMWDGVGVMEAQTKVLVRLALITKGAGQAIGDLERTSGSFANQMRKLAGLWKDLRVEIGGFLKEQFRPYLTALNEGLEATGKWIKANEDWLKLKIARPFEIINKELGKMKKSMGPVTKWLQANKELLGDIVPLIIAFAPLLLVASGGALALAGQLAGVAASIIIVVGGIASAIAMLNPWVVGILALVAALGVLFTQTDIFVGLLEGWRDMMKEDVSIINALKTSLLVLGDFISNQISNAWSNLLAMLGPQTIKTFEGLRTEIKKLWANVKGVFGAFVDQANTLGLDWKIVVKSLIKSAGTFVSGLLAAFLKILTWVNKNWPAIQKVIVDTLTLIAWTIQNVIIPAIEYLATSFAIGIKVMAELVAGFGDLVLFVFKRLNQLPANWRKLWGVMGDITKEWINKIKWKIQEWKDWMFDVFDSIREWLLDTFDMSARHSPSVLDVLGGSLNDVKGMLANFGADLAGSSLTPALTAGLANSAMGGGAVTDNRTVNMNVTDGVGVEVLKRAVTDAMALDSVARQGL